MDNPGLWTVVLFALLLGFGSFNLSYSLPPSPQQATFRAVGGILFFVAVALVLVMVGNL